MTPPPIKSFVHTHRSGRKFMVEFYHDDSHYSPLEDDGHGFTVVMPGNFDPSDPDNVQDYIDERYVEESRLEEFARYSMLRELRQGGRHSDALFYDVWETRKLALVEGWGPGVEWDKANPDATRHERAAAAVEADYKFLRGFYDADWHYVVLAVYALDENDEKIDGIGNVCGGYESTIMDNEKWLEEVLEDSIRHVEFERRARENPGQLPLRFA